MSTRTCIEDKGIFSVLSIIYDEAPLKRLLTDKSHELISQEISTIDVSQRVLNSLLKRTEYEVQKLVSETANTWAQDVH